MYFHSDQVEVDNVEVHDDPVEYQGDKFFLSDHFASSAPVTFGRTTKADPPQAPLLSPQAMQTSQNDL